MPEQIHNKPELKEIRRSLRKDLTPAEATLWKVLKGKGLEGRKFRRQHTIGKFIVDFYCPSEKLVIELDGQHHFTITGEWRDFEKENYIKSQGIKILRFENSLIRFSLPSVLDEIIANFNLVKNIK